MINNWYQDIINKNLYTKSIYLKIGYTDDIIPSTGGSRKLEVSTNQYSIILENILNLCDKTTNKDELIRRIYIGFGNLTKNKEHQLDLFHNINNNIKEIKLEQTINKIKDKYGKSSILRAISYEEKATQRIRNKLIGGHNAE